MGSYIEATEEDGEMQAIILLLAAAVIGSCSATDSETRIDYLGRLKRDLFMDYDKTVIPLAKEKEPVNLALGATAYNLKLNEKDELDMLVWARLTWDDLRLKWDPKEYHGISVFRIPADQLWIPDIQVYNAIEYGPGSWSSTFGDSSVNALVYSNGEVLYIPPVNVKVQCSNAETQANPWSEYDCKMKLGSWTLDGYSMNVTKYNNQNCIDTNDLDPTSPVFITANSCTKEAREVKHYDCCEEPYISIQYDFRVQRRFAVGPKGALKKNDNMEKPFGAYPQE